MKTRGTGNNPHNRYQPRRIETVADERPHFVAATEDNTWATPDSIATTVVEEQARTIISTNRSPDVPFDQSINPYRGCEHGCIYCFARPTHAYWDLSPGLDFETKLIAKPNAANLLRQTLDKPRYQCKPIALGVNTDAYQPVEKARRITRELLEVLWEYRHPVSLITKSALILRDIDLLSSLARERLCSVFVSITTLDNDLKRIMEPRTAAPGTRLKVVRELRAAGIPTGVLVAPVIPFINDHEMEAILDASAEAGAQRAGWVLLRLPLEVAPLFETWLQDHFPDRARHVMHRMEDLRGGKVYDSTFGKRMAGSGPYAELLRQRFARQCRKLSLNQREPSALRTDLFRRPGADQLTLW
ncbi:PA0069 family radical SAM protein [Mangrovitalea sediminis]|uniref:PA0069 family radical SAM protein n=1 Tax=Mangrovitalea sediminis TaxID=1982043 RepID=UPI000BE55DE9|nr:PA0069 family radical SAM protein [Mangrovitalea sediminis]